MDAGTERFARLSEGEKAAARELFFSVFTQPPWNDDWSDGAQLDRYLHDLMGQSNSLAFGLYRDGALIALSMGRVKHWYTGAEYCVDELCVARSVQRQGVGSRFLGHIEDACREMGLTHLFLLTEDHVPAYEFYQKLGFRRCAHTAALAKQL